MATVQDAANAYAEAEKHLRKAQKELAKLPDTYKTVYEDPNHDFGYLEYRARAANIAAVIGLIAEAEYSVTLSHIEDTERAIELGIDVGPASGGDDINILGGGPR